MLIPDDMRVAGMAMAGAFGASPLLKVHETWHAGLGTTGAVSRRFETLGGSAVGANLFVLHDTEIRS